MIATMDLFTPVVPIKQQHPNFRALATAGLESERDVLRRWAEGFHDRDGKFVTEFQTTFNSSFWELYLHASFRELGFELDYGHSSPDFYASSRTMSFVAEAAIASHADGFAAEWEADFGEKLSPERTAAMLEYASIRLANAFDGKLRKFRSHYSHLAHVVDRAFVICLAPFEQPHSYAFADRALRRLLYAYDMPVYVLDDEGNRVVLGASAAERVWKASGAEVEFGLFTDPRASEVSAVIYSSVATFGKVQALAGPEREAVFTALRYNAEGPQPFLINAVRENYEEGLLDGIHLYLNPHAAHPLDTSAFTHDDIAIHYGFDENINMVRTSVPHGFLFSRSVLAFARGTSGSTPRPPRRGRVPEIVPWPDSELHRVGGNFTTFADNHLAHYKGWTVLVARDRVDDDWGAQACEGTFRDLSSFLEGQRDEGRRSLLAPKFVSTREEAFLMMKANIDGLLT